MASPARALLPLTRFYLVWKGTARASWPKQCHLSPPPLADPLRVPSGRFLWRGGQTRDWPGAHRSAAATLGLCPRLPVEESTGLDPLSSGEGFQWLCSLALQEDLEDSHHADNTLQSFCKWQKSINRRGCPPAAPRHGHSAHQALWAAGSGEGGPGQLGEPMEGGAT